MGEQQPQGFEELVRELEEEYGTQEAPAPDVEQLLQDLQADSIDTKKAAAVQLGKLEESSLEIVEALVVAQETDAIYAVKKAAEEALRAPAHQQYLQQAIEETALARRQALRQKADVDAAEMDRQATKTARAA